MKRKLFSGSGLVRRMGATLLELLIALTIIGIMLGVLLPAAWGVYKAALKLGE